MSTVQFARRRNLITAATLAALVALAAGGFALRSTDAESKPPASAAQPQAMPVPVQLIEKREVTTWDEFSGRLEAVERVDVRSRVARPVKSVHFVKGALVTRLWDESAIARRELDERVNAEQEADAGLRAAQAALTSAKLNLSYTRVRAPVSGRVGRLEVTVGNLVPAGPGAPVLTTLVSVSPIYASFDADEQVVTKALKDVGGNGGPASRSLERIPVQMGTAASTDTPF